MIVSFGYPTTARYSGGIAALFEYADGLARRGHEVHMIHGPALPDTIRHIDELTWFRFEPGVAHHVVASLDDPSLPAADVVFPGDAPSRLGHPAVLIQGYKLLSAAMERPAFRAPCPKVCVARWLVDVGVAWGSPREQMLHVPLGIDHDLFQVRTPLDDRDVDVAMLYSTHPVKGGDDGIAALEEVRRRRPDLRVALFGILKPSGDVPEWATYHHAPSQTDLAELYGRARILVQPSRREGFGLIAVEGMASGCALVTTDNGGSRDYADDGRTAVVVPPRAPAALADAIDALLDDEPRRLRLAQAGAEHVRRFDWDVAAERLEGHLERYLTDPAALQAPPSDAPMFLEETW